MNRDPVDLTFGASTKRVRPTAIAREAEIKRLVVALGASALLAILAGTASAAPATGAIVTRDNITSYVFENGLTDDCHPGLIGTLNRTDVFSYQSVETSQHFRITATIIDTGRINWSDGTYTIIESVDHFSADTGNGTTVFTDVHKASGNTYTADGVFLFRGTFHLVDHSTVTDGVVVRVEFERGRLDC